MSDLPTIRVLGFKTEYKVSDGKPKPVDWVLYAPISAPLTMQTWARISDMMPPERDINNDDEGKKLAFMRHRWAMIEPAYLAWKQGNDIPVDGTPLSAWAGITPEQVRVLQGQGIRTVEEIAKMTDGAAAKVHLPNVRDMIKQARLFLESADAAVAAQKAAQQDARIADLEEKLAAAMELLEQNVKPKRGPGRPLKEDQPDSEAA